MQHYVTRATYNRLFVAATGEAPSEELATYVESQYPKSTAAAAVELRQRGLGADGSSLAYLVKRGDVPRLNKRDDARGYAWTPGAIDLAAEVLDRDGRRTLWGAMLEYFGIDADQAARSRAEVLAGLPEATDSDLGAIVVPGLPGQGVSANIRYISRAAAVAMSKIGG